MNSFAMAIHTVLEAVSALLHAGDARLYLLLTCTSILFSVFIIFRRRKDAAGEASHRWVPVSATSSDRIVACQSPQSLKCYFTQHQDTPTTSTTTTVHRKHRHQCQCSEYFQASGYNEDSRDKAINVELQCSDRLESRPRGANGAVVNQHKLPPISREMLHCITDSSHLGELSQPAITDTSQTDELSLPAIRDTNHTDELSRPAITNTNHVNELSQQAITDTNHVNELSQPAIRDTNHTDEMSQPAIRDTTHTDEMFQPAITDCSHTDELNQPAITDTSHVDELCQPAIKDTTNVNELSQPAIRDTTHTDELSQESITDTTHTDELCQPAIGDTTHTGELAQRAITDATQVNELSQRAITDATQVNELSQCAFTDSFHSDELSHRALADSYRPSDQPSLHECSSSSHVQEGLAITTSATCCDSGQDVNTVHCETTFDTDHQREITHSFTDHHKRNKYQKEIFLHNKEKSYTGNPESVDTVLICDQDNDQRELLWRQLSLDSRQLPRSHHAIRPSSTSNIVHTCDKHTRELRLRHRDYVPQSAAAFCSENSCKTKASSEVSSVHSPGDSDAPPMMYTSSNIHCADQLSGSGCTCMSKSAHTQNNPVFSQEISHQQIPVSSEFPQNTYITVVHSFPITRSKYNGFRSNSERRASRSHKQMSNVVCQRLGEISPQNYATTAHTTLGNCYSQESMSPKTSCVVESNSLTDCMIPLHSDRISSNLSHSSASATILYRNPKQRHSNRRFRAIELEGHDFPDMSASADLPNNLQDIYSNHLNPQALPETAIDRHELGKLQSDTANTPTSLHTQVQLRRKRWGRSYCIPAERSQSMQMDSMPRALSLAIPVKSQSNDSLSRRRVATLADLEQHLSTHTKGIFRRRVSVNNMLTWSKDPIQKPMIRSKDKGIRKAACEIFKMIQTYMGDRKGKQAEILVALDVVTRGWSTPSLRDEIYVQLMRQTTDNKRDESLQSGWELLAMCLYFFPPSLKFQSCLESYISKHLEPFSNTDSVPSSEMSAHCLRRLKRAQKIGTKMAIYKPTLEELEHAKATMLSPTMFGNTLEDIMLLQRDRYPDRQLPWIQTVLSEEILRLHGAQTEGIFRVSGDIDEVNSLKTQCDKWILPTDCIDPHIPASLLKTWYRELFEPVIPAEFYQACVENFSNVEAAIAIVYQLPHLNHLVLCYLIRFLQLLASPGNVAFTKMDVNNLAMVMAPSCLRYESQDLLTIYQNVQREMGFVRTLILYLDTSFMEGIV